MLIVVETNVKSFIFLIIKKLLGLLGEDKLNCCYCSILSVGYCDNIFSFRTCEQERITLFEPENCLKSRILWVKI